MKSIALRFNTPDNYDVTSLLHDWVRDTDVPISDAFIYINTETVVKVKKNVAMAKHEAFPITIDFETLSDSIRLIVSKHIQEKLFELGYSWKSGQKEFYPHGVCLNIYKDKSISLGRSPDGTTRVYLIEQLDDFLKAAEEFLVCSNFNFK